MLYKVGQMSLYVRTKSKFGFRISEWMIALQTFTFGAVLLLPNETYNTSPVFNFLRHVVSEEVLGIFMLAIGATHLVALTINGARQDVTPTLRAVSAFIGFMAWTLISFSFALSGVVSTWIAIYPFIAGFELVNMYRATHDAGEYSGGTS